MGNAVSAGEEDAGQVDRDRPFPDLDGRIEALVLGQDDACVVEHDIEAAERACALVDEASAGDGVGNVARYRHGLAAHLADPAGARRRRLAPYIGADHARALAGEFEGRGFADPASRAADEGALSGQTH